MDQAAVAQKQLLEYVRTVGMTTMEGRGFYYPVDSAVAKDGRIYVINRSVGSAAVARPTSMRVTVLNIEGEYFGTFGSLGSGEGQFIWPAGIALDREGRVYITDEFRHRVSVFDDSGVFIAQWGVHGAGPGELNGPSGIAFDPDDNVLLADTGNHRVQRFGKDGDFISGFGVHGSGDGEFDMPWGLTTDRDGDVLVADWGNDRVQRFSADGRFVARYGATGRGEGQMVKPSSVAVDGDGYVYVADWGNERLRVFSPEGACVQTLRGQATLSEWAHDFLRTNTEEAEARARADLEPEIEFFNDDPHEESSHIEKLFWSPVSVVLDDAGRVYVTEGNRHRIQVFERAS